MPSFADQNQLIKDFLLGKLSEEDSQEVESRIFAEPEFGEEVEIVETELMNDYANGTMDHETRVLFEQKYERTLANRNELQYQALFNEFIRSKPPVEAPAVEASAPAVVEPITVPRESWFPAFIMNPVTIGVTTALFALIVAFVLWSRFGSGPKGIDPELAEQRRAIEQQLQRVNATTAFRSSYELLLLDLRPIERSNGQIARIALRKGETNRLIEFHLNVAHAEKERYRILFLDDKHNELFAMDGLPTVATPNGQQVQFFVPSEYLKPADYQIELSLADGKGGRSIVDSYAFRVLETN
jgi:hypothetical protein